MYIFFTIILKNNVTLHRISKRNNPFFAYNKQINNKINNIYYFYEHHSFFFPEA